MSIGGRQWGLQGPKLALDIHADTSPTGKGATHKTYPMHTASVEKASVTATANPSRCRDHCCVGSAAKKSLLPERGSGAQTDPAWWTSVFYIAFPALVPPFPPSLPSFLSCYVSQAGIDCSIRLTTNRSKSLHFPDFTCCFQDPGSSGGNVPFSEEEEQGHNLRGRKGEEGSMIDTLKNFTHLHFGSHYEREVFVVLYRY